MNTNHHQTAGSARPFLLSSLLGTLLLGAFSNTVQARPGDLDPTFGNGGVVSTVNPNYASSIGNSALQADGKIVVVGAIGYAGSGDGREPFVARYKTDGTLDPTFGNGGVVTTHFQQQPNVNDNGSYNAVAIQSDGKIIAAGISSQNSLSFYYSDPVLARYNSDGSLDATFGSGGKVFTNTGTQASGFYASGSMMIYNLRIAPDGSFYAIGGDGDRSVPGSGVYVRPAMIIKYSSNGSVIASVFPNYTPIDPFLNKRSTTSVLQPDGKLIVNLNGNRGSSFSIADFVLMRFNSDLSVDTTFGTNGLAITDFGTGIEQANGIVLDPNGKITVSGNQGSRTTFAARYNPNGSLDTGFGNNGKVVILDAGGLFYGIGGQGIVRQPDGKYVIAFGTISGGLGALRLLPSGSLDPTFGYGGIANYQSNSPDSPYPTLTGIGGGILLQPDGKILLPANETNQFATVNGIKILRLLNTTTSGQPLLNISTRVDVLTGDKASIGGFIITGTDAKRVLLRAIGSSLAAKGVSGALQDPVLELHDRSGTIATNDNWRTTQIGGVITSDQQAAIQNTGAEPTNDKESAIIATLPPAAYTAVVWGVNNTTGIGLVEAYDLDQAANSKLANISTRGFVDTGNNVMIGGFILGSANGANAK